MPAVLIPAQYVIGIFTQNQPMVRQFSILCAIILLSLSLPAQNQEEKDFGDLFRPEDANKTSEPEIKRLYLPLLPIISYAPANGFILGVGIAPGILLDSAHHTHISSALAYVQFTSKKQVNFNFRHNVYLPHDRIIFQGDWRVLIYSQNTYGLGITNLPGAFSLNGDNLSEDESGAQPMTFTYYRLYETVFTRIKGRLYGGLGLAFDLHQKIVDERLDLEAEPPFYTSHYLYSELNDFSTEKYAANGVLFRMLYDNRDNAINAYKGIYVDAGFRYNPRWLGSTKPSSQILFEFRNYQRVGKKDNRFAFWLIGQFLTSGQLPYLANPAIGWDTYNRSGRGYIQGRYRGENMAYGELEYRFRLTKNGLLGGVLFLNTITTDNSGIDQVLFERFAFGYGTGLRFKMSKETRTNICIDLGFGQNGSGGVYFGLQEAF